MEPQTARGTIRFAGNYELDVRAWELRRSGRVIRLERIPMEILILLADQPGQLVTRDEIVEKIWGRGVHLDTDNSINAAVRKLRQALREDPEKPRVIQTVTGKGYRFVASIATGNSDAAAAPAVAVTEVVDAPHPERRRPAIRSGVWLLGLAVALTATAIVTLRSTRSGAGTSRGRVMLAVLPFENLTGDREQDYFSDGLTEEMISRLGNLEPRRLGVIARASVMQYKLNPKPLAAISRELKVDFALEGSVRRDENKVRISAQLIRMRDGTHVWARQYDRELIHLLAVQEEIAQAVVDQIEVTLANGRIGDLRVTPSRPNYQAYDLYLRGRYFLNKRTAEGFQRAAENFQQAIERDPTYARAYAGLADTHALMSTYYLGASRDLIPKARSAALRALELDERLAEAHTCLALISEVYDWDWEAAEREFRRAIELEPNDATAHDWYAELLGFQERFEEALSESNQARHLDPLSLIIATDQATILYLARRYDEAIEQFRSVLQKQADFHKPYVLIWAYAQRGMFPEALAEIEKWRRESDEPWNWAAQAYVNGRSGRVKASRAALERLEQFAREHPSDPMPMLPIAYLGIGDRERALVWLEKSVRERASSAMWLKADPLLESLRDDPRFQELLHRVGLG